MSKVVFFVSKRLKEYRIQRGYTQEYLAELSGLHNTYIGQVERGEKNITISSLEKILDALEISFSDLFEGMPSKSDDFSENYPLLCYEMLLEKDHPTQKTLYEILSQIDTLIDI